MLLYVAFFFVLFSVFLQMGNLTVENLVSKCYCVAEFKDCKWLGKGQMVEGYVYNER